MSKRVTPPAASAVEEGIHKAMSRIKYRLVVFSGKGGVGKTTVSVNLAYAMVQRGKRVGLLDADITGPNVPQMVGLSGVGPQTEGGMISPYDKDGLKIISLASMIPPGTPVIWRGPLRSKAIHQLLGEVNWGELDFLIGDLPPGTGDEVLTITQRAQPQLAIVVTTPQEVSLIDARRAVNMAKEMKVPAIGIVENMSGLVCPHCGGRIDLFGEGGGQRVAAELEVKLLGEVPIDLKTRVGGDSGVPIILSDPETPVSLAFFHIVDEIERALEEG